MTDFTHPLDPLEITERRAMAQEFADARDQLALSRGLEPHQPQRPTGATEESENGTD